MNLICFTVLHYGEEDITIKCIDSIISRFNSYNIRILVLDNGSRNNSYERLCERYADKKEVSIYRSDENLGFTRGNNFLYSKAKEENPDYVLILNNDISFKQKNFLEILDKIARESNAYVIGPDVYSPRQKAHQAPLYVEIPSMDELEESMTNWQRIIDSDGADYNESKLSKRIIKSKLYELMPETFFVCYRKIKKIMGRAEGQNLLYKKAVQNPVLQGSCIITTKQFLKNESIVFEPDTTFYFEELLLAQKCKQKGYQTIYDPRIQVVHNHAYASRGANGDYREYMVKQAKRMLYAYNIYREHVSKQK